MYSKYNFGMFNPTNALKSIHILDIGYHDHTKVKAFYTKPKSSFYPTFHIVLEGKGELSYKNQKYALSAGDIFFLPPNVRHLYLPNAENPYKFIWIGIEGSELSTLLKKKGIDDSTPILHAKNNTKMFTILKNFIDTTSQKNVTEEKMLSLFFSFFDCIKDVSTTKHKHHKPSSKYVDAIMALINNNYMHAQFTVQSISNIIHVSHSWLCSLFKKETGFSMQSVLINVRLGRAVSLLTEENLPINEISSLCGFSDALYFSARFKKNYGVSPMEYRKTHTKTNTQK